MNTPSLPISIQTFTKIRDPELNYIYVDKTKEIIDFIHSAPSAYLSRPRRFGKSLMLDTIKELFEGNQVLFKGLYAEQHWDWNKAHPVIRIDFTGMDCASVEELARLLSGELLQICEKYQLDIDKCADVHTPTMLANCLKQLHETTGHTVVFLVDEYDYPLVHSLDNIELATQIQKFLGSFYAMLKKASAHLCYVLITGVSKFTKMSLFSQANQLNELSISPEASTVCGYTHQEVLDNFAEYLQGVNLDKMKYWYNGYNFLGEPVYNPYDVLLFLSSHKYENYWWQTGGTSLLTRTLKAQKPNIPDFEAKLYSSEVLNNFDLDKTNIVALLWQSGYLTFEEEIEHRGRIKYRMKYPNFEVQNSLHALFLQVLTANDAIEQKADYLIDALFSHDAQMIKDQFNALLASIPYQNYSNNDIANYEGYYASVIYGFLYYLTVFRAHTELSTSDGRIDLVLEGETEVFVIELKMHESAFIAVKQVEEKKYYQRYLNSGKQIHLLGIKFDQEKRVIGEVTIQTRPSPKTDGQNREGK